MKNYLTLLYITLACLLAITISENGLAQESTETEITIDQVNEVASEIWCPLCSGVRLDACELTACDQMKQEIAIQLADGADTESIKAYFLDQYGPQTLGEPPRSGFYWLAWLTPLALLLISGILLILRFRSQSTRETQPAPSRVQQDDPYAELLDQELRRYE